jgi:DNA polymerase (family 10)
MGNRRRETSCYKEFAVTNEEIAQKLRQHAANLARGGDNLYRVRAFRQAALAVLTLSEPVTGILANGGRGALAQVPGIGRSLATTIDRLAAAHTFG